MTGIIRSPNAELIESSEVPGLLKEIRPAWQAKNLISRVNRLVSVDPSSACQRLFNAAIHDLKEKLIIAGEDVAGEAAKQYKLPTITRKEDVENYSTSNVIDLAYRVGILSRPEWRRLSRCYEIRRDLEHEDDEYEAGIEDCVYIFQTCIGAVLSKDPVHLIRVTDVKDLVEQPEAAVPDASLVEDYQRAPQPRQEEILKFLASVALDKEKAELVRQNAFTFLSYVAEDTQNSVRLTLASHLQSKLRRTDSVKPLIRVAFASGTLPYIKKAHRKDYFESILAQMKKVGHRWSAHKSHGPILRELREVGGVEHCPVRVRKSILEWMILAYIGSPGGRTRYGNVRNVFYSNSAAPLIEDMVKSASSVVQEDVKGLAESGRVRKAVVNDHIQRRLDAMLDMVDAASG